MKNTYLESIIALTAQRLLTVYHDRFTAYNTAWEIIQSITGKKKEALLFDLVSLTPYEHGKLEAIIHALTECHMPLYYALGSAPFLSLDISIWPPMLIPRPETEAWCALVIDTIRPLVAQATLERPFIALDVCTGSGCIALALADAFKNSFFKVIGLDISPKAIACAQKNAKKLQLENCSFILSDLYNALPPSFACDMIVTNPPYITQKEYPELEPEVRLWEDKNALIAQNNGYELIRKIAEQGKTLLRNDYNCSQIWCEIGSTQGAQTVEFYKNYNYSQITIIKDIAQRDRVVYAKKE